MSRHAKTLARIARKPAPADIRWADLKAALEWMGFETLTGTGSRRKFFHREKNVLISLHEPHPSPEVCKAAIDDVRRTLEAFGFLP